MTIYYVTTGPWGTGTGTPNSAAQVDGNFYDVSQQLVDLTADLAEGKRIDTVTYGDNSMTFHFTDGSVQVIPLPVVQLQYVGPWTNSTPYTRGQFFSSGSANGYYQVLVDHTTPAAPTPFDPDATDATTDHNPLYSLWFPLRDVNYDAAIFVPGSIQRGAGELLFQGVANRPMNLSAARAYAYLDVGNDASGVSDIVLSIEKNGTEIGTITFEADGAIDATGGQEGAIVILTSVDFAEGDRYGLRISQSDNAEPSGLSVTLPFVRTDI